MSTLTPNMNLSVPGVGTEIGPNWANEINSDLNILDQHNHNSGSGVAITPSGLNISSDLPFNGNNATLLRSLRFSPQTSALIQPADLGCVYVIDLDLYYNDVSGNTVRLTQSGAVAGTPGSISNLVPPASANYVMGSQSFVWQSGVNIPANSDGASVILRNLTAGSFGLTLSPPPAMAANFSIVLPSLPASSAIVTMDNAGNQGTTIPNSTISIAGSVAKVADNSLGQGQVLAGFGFVPSGSIIPFGGVTAPTGYLLCDGTSYLKASFAALYSAIADAYGSVDATHFNVPDLRGQFLRGVTGASANDPGALTRTAMNVGGNTGNNVGSIQAGSVGPHSHTIAGGPTGAGTSGNPQQVVQSDATGLGMNTGTNTGAETRPINAYVNFIIKT